MSPLFDLFVFAILLATVSLVVRFRVFGNFYDYFLSGAKTENRDSLRRVISITRRSFQPSLTDFRSGRIQMGELKKRIAGFEEKSEKPIDG